MLLFLQTILAVLLIVLILLQARGSGIGSAWGGAGELYVTRRGVEKFLFRATIFLAFLFVLVSLSLFFSR